MRRFVWLALTTILLFASELWGANSVVVSSRTVIRGADGVRVPILISNDVSLSYVTVPLRIRSITPGCYITGLSMSFEERLPLGGGAPLTDIRYRRTYPTPDGTCKPAGFSTNDSLDFVTPDGILFQRGRVLAAPYLTPGEDIYGSFVLTLDVNTVVGEIEIDTTCINPNTHLGFVDDLSSFVMPTFTPGYVTVVSSDNSATVSSRTVMQGAQDVEIPIIIHNDIDLLGIQLPLVIRTVSGGAYITSLSMAFDDRLTPGGPLILARLTHQYANDDGACKDGQPGGFQTLSFTDGGPNPVASSPEGAMFVALAAGADELSPGFDNTGSLLLTVDVNSAIGSFEIDTSCVVGGSMLHPVFLPDGPEIVPGFTKGIVDIDPRRVTSLADAGEGSLREAIEWANSQVFPDTIRFDVAGTIYLQSPLPSLDDQTGGTLIDGFTAPGATSGPYFQPAITLDGTSAGVGPAFLITDSTNGALGCVIRGLRIRNFPGGGIVVGPSAGTRHEFAMNLIHENGGIGIDLNDDGVTLNDYPDSDIGPNGLLNYPTIDTVRLLADDQFHVAGRAGGRYVDLYLAGKYLGEDTVVNASGHGDAWQYLGTATVDTSKWMYSHDITARNWSYVTAVTRNFDGSTSEFAKNRRLIPDSLIFTAYSPVTITVFEPDSSDSIGPGFNTIGSTADYDSTSDWGVGPDGVPGEPDDRVVITNVEDGDYRVRIDGKPGSEGDEYFFGIRVDGTNEAWAGAGQVTSAVPIPNPVPPPGEPDEIDYTPEPSRRGDFDHDGDLTALDLNALIDFLFFSAPPPSPVDLADLNCDGFPDALDLNYLIDHMFFSGPLPCM